MKINENCLPCLIGQVIKVANITNIKNRDMFYRGVFQYLGKLNFTKTNPEIIGATFEMIKQQVNDEDPYFELRKYYNELFLSRSTEFENKINSFETAVKYAIIGNIIDFSPIYNTQIKDIDKWFENIDQLKLAINQLEEMITDIKSAKVLLYLGDNCGEICLDKLLIRRIKKLNPEIDIYFGVRGKPVVNDSIEADAYFVGMDEYATIISNGDNSLGTVLERTSNEFKRIYRSVDIVIAKGQANFESLSEQEKNIYFLLMVKCEVIANYIGVAQKSLICLNYYKSMSH